MSTQVPALRPLGFGEILDVGIKIFFRNAKTLLKLVLFVVMPVNVLSALVLLSVPDSSFDIGNITSEDAINADGQLTFDTSGFWPWFAGIGITTALGLLASTLATAACFNAIVTAYLGEKPEWRRSLSFAGRRLHSVVWVSVLGFLLPMLGLLLCVFPGIWLYGLFAVSVPVLLTEGTKGVKALGRSKRLVTGRWWNVFGVIVVSTVLASIVSGVLGGLAAGTAFAAPDNDVLNVLVTYVANTIAATLTVPFTAAVIVVLYIDLRVRKEAFDLQVLATSIGVDTDGTESAVGSLFPATPVVPTPYQPGQPPSTDQPPFWPPPPGWKPPSDRQE